MLSFSLSPLAISVAPLALGGRLPIHYFFRLLRYLGLLPLLVVRAACPLVVVGPLALVFEPLALGNCSLMETFSLLGRLLLTS